MQALSLAAMTLLTFSVGGAYAAWIGRKRRPAASDDRNLELLRATHRELRREHDVAEVELEHRSAEVEDLRAQLEEARALHGSLGALENQLDSTLSQILPVATDGSAHDTTLLTALAKLEQALAARFEQLQAAIRSTDDSDAAGLPAALALETKRRRELEERLTRLIEDRDAREQRIRDQLAQASERLLAVDRALDVALNAQR